MIQFGSGVATRPSSKTLTKKEKSKKISYLTAKAKPCVTSPAFGPVKCRPRIFWSPPRSHITWGGRGARSKVAKSFHIGTTLTITAESLSFILISKSFGPQQQSWVWSRTSSLESLNSNAKSLSSRRLRAGNQSADGTSMPKTTGQRNSTFK